MTDTLAPDVIAFPPDPKTRAWADAAWATARPMLSDPAHDHWWRHGRTWFAGVNILPNAADGSIEGVSLAGPALDWIAEQGWTPEAWDAAQISVVRPGYPDRDPNESEGAHRFRRLRDAAHVDGILPIGPARRRMVREHHAFILGLPLTDADTGASPLVVWEGSHRVVAEMFRHALGGLPEEDWGTVDLTYLYTETRKRVFESCPRREIHVPVGGAILVHRFTIHGIAPWEKAASSDPNGRAIAYFRPGKPLKDWMFGA